MTYNFHRELEAVYLIKTKAVSLNLMEYFLNFHPYIFALHPANILNFIRNTSRETITMSYLQYQQPCNAYLDDIEDLLPSCYRSLFGIRSCSFPDSKLLQLQVQEQSLLVLDCQATPDQPEK